MPSLNNYIFDNDLIIKNKVEKQFTKEELLNQEWFKNYKKKNRFNGQFLCDDDVEDNEI